MDEPAPLEGLTFCLAGAGRVGSSLAHWACARGARLAAVTVHDRRAPAAELRRDLGPLDLTTVDDLSSAGADLLLVAVSDPALDDVVRRLTAHPQAAVVLHTAGARGASALAPLRAAGSRCGTLHPLKAFPHPLPDPAAARGVLFALDGDAAAVELARRLADAWGGVPRVVPEAVRDLYHLAATLAAGGAVTLLAAAERVADAAGLPRDVLPGYLELARGAVAAAGEELETSGSFAGAITGPAARGDEATVRRQLASLAAERPELAELAAVLARETLETLAEHAPPSPGQRRLRAALERFRVAGEDENDDGVC